MVDPHQDQVPARFRRTPRTDHNVTRIIVIVALAALTGLLIALVGGPYGIASGNWLQSPARMTLPADILYRVSVGLAASGYQPGNSVTFSARQLQQIAIALYERDALGPQRSAQASYRLGIIYAKSGYRDHARAMFEEAMRRDAENTKFYSLLARLYTDKSVEAQSLLKRAGLLDGQARWLATMTWADLYERVGQRDQAEQLRAYWHDQQVEFSGVIGILMGFYALMGLVGGGMLAMLVIAWLSGGQRRVSPWRKPWNLMDVAEALVVLLLLLVCVPMAMTALRGIIGPALSSETTDALLTAVGYLFCGVCTIALIVYRIVYRIGSRRSVWKLLGLKWHRVTAGVGQGIAGFGVVVALLVIALSVLGQFGIERIVPLAPQAPLEMFLKARNPLTFVIYFILVGIFAPIVEEIIFRGFVYPGLRRVMTVPAAALTSALVFAAAHIAVPVGGLLTITLIGIVLAYLYERSESLIAPVITHAMYNSFVLLLLAAYALI